MTLFVTEQIDPFSYETFICFFLKDSPAFMILYIIYMFIVEIVLFK